MPISPDELERELRARQPAVRFVSERRLRKILHFLQHCGTRCIHNADLPLWVSREALADSNLMTIDESMPPQVLLLTPPEDRGLSRADDGTIRERYARLLSRAERETSTVSDIPTVFHALSAPIQREIRFVLQSEHLVPETPTDAEVAVAFGLYHWELSEFDATALPQVFPLLSAESSPHRAKTVETGAIRVEPVTNSAAVDPAAERWLARGNFARAAVAGSSAAVPALCESLGRILGWTDATRAAWQAALAPLVTAATNASWPPEMRALYTLQRIVGDFAGSLDAVAPVEWLASFGRKPLRRPLEPVGEVIVQRRLRQAAKHILNSTLSAHDRHAVEHLLEAEIDAADGRIRRTFTPVMLRIFDDAGFRPTNLPERIGRDNVIAELLDRLSENGLARMADLRDAIARNSLKMQDYCPGDFLRGDVLLQIDKRLADELYGVYHRGEVYLRGIQRFSGLAFGTRLGRWLTLFVALPFGGAFLAIEAAKHLAHAATSVAGMLVRLIEGSPAPEHPKEHHGPAFSNDMLLAIAILGTFLLALIHLPPVRAAVLKFLSLFGQGMRLFLITVPQTLWLSRPVRLLLDNRFTRFVSVYVLWPSLFAITALLLLTVLGVRMDYSIPGGAMVFVAVAALSITRWGSELREDVADYSHKYGRRFLADFIPGLFGYVLWFFRELLGRLERGLYAIDEWFRYREGQSKPSLALKAGLALVWFPVAYIVRFAFYLLLEPQVNPIKHFPVVTVSHKVLIPLVGSIQKLFNVTQATAGLIVTAIPGIFGFLVWEFKENWRLYAANRSPMLPAVPLGHHGETMRGLLRPGFHSGTIPKLYRKLRHAVTDRKQDKLEHELHHLHVAIERLIERNLLAYWQTLLPLVERMPRIANITLGVLRVEVAISRAGAANDLHLSFENIDGAIIGTIDDLGWVTELDANTRTIVVESLHGLFAAATVGEVAWTKWLTLWNDK